MVGGLLDVGAPILTLFVSLITFKTYISGGRARPSASCARLIGPFVKASFANGACPKTRTPFKVMRLDPSGNLPK